MLGQDNVAWTLTRDDSHAGGFVLTATHFGNKCSRYHHHAVQKPEQEPGAHATKSKGDCLHYPY